MAPASSSSADLALTRAALILHLRASGIMNTDVLRAFETTPHEAFVPDEYAAYAYQDAALPIGEGQSLTSPMVLAPFIELLDAAGAARALLIGTGSGYSSMLLSKLARRVFSVERNPALLATAEARWRALNVVNIVGFHADGLAEAAGQAPFDRILLTGSVHAVPAAVEDNLAEDGVLVAAIGDANSRQIITRIVRGPSSLVVSEHGTVRLPPLLRGKMRAG